MLRQAAPIAISSYRGMDAEFSTGPLQVRLHRADRHGQLAADLAATDSGDGQRCDPALLRGQFEW